MSNIVTVNTWCLLDNDSRRAFIFEFGAPLEAKHLFGEMNFITRKGFHDALQYLDDKNITEVYFLCPEEAFTICMNLTIEVVRLKYKFVENTKFTFITSAVDGEILRLKEYNNINIMSWMGFWAHQTIHEILLHYQHGKNSGMPIRGHDKIIKPTNPSKSFIYMSGKSRHHRCILIDYLYKYDLFKDGYITWNKKYDLNTHGCRIYKFRWWEEEKILKLEDQYSDIDWLKDQIERGKFEREIIDNNNGSFSTPYVWGRIAPKQFSDSLFSVISETHIDSLFYTEKTFMPILNQRPFIIQGFVGMNHYLKGLGYELFEEVIDYSFDMEEDIETRTKMMVNEIKKITTYDLNALHNQLKPKLEHNCKILLDNVLANNYMDKELENFLNQLDDNIVSYDHLLYNKNLDQSSKEYYKKHFLNNDD